METVNRLSEAIAAWTSQIGRENVLSGPEQIGRLLGAAVLLRNAAIQVPALGRQAPELGDLRIAIGAVARRPGRGEKRRHLGAISPVLGAVREIHEFSFRLPPHGGPESIKGMLIKS